MNPAIFREYDIRGIVGQDLTEAGVERIARATGTIFSKKGKRRVAVGRDVRHSSAAFAGAVARGFTAAGLDVEDLGVLPTPVLYQAIIRRDLGGGIMVTGSHNPIDYNGLKVCDGPLASYGDEIQAIRRVAEGGVFASGSGTVTAVDFIPEYCRDLLERFRPSRKFRVVVDCGNGVAGPLIPGLLRALGHEVEELYTEPDGNFPNHLPDPEVAEYMRDLVARVRDGGADLGLGFDGDGDRLGVIDETGRKISADWLIAVFARDLLTRWPGGIVRYDVKCGDFLAGDVRAHGGVPVMGRTGHSILKRDIKESGAILGGELSGHICFGREYWLTDDPFYCSLKFLDLMGTSVDGRCSALFAGIPRTFATAEIKAAVPDAEKFTIVQALSADFARDHEVITVDGARVVFPDGWGLVRASNTTANLTIRFESRTREGLDHIRSVFLERLARQPAIDLTNIRKAGS